jgi:hypothetical protein
METFSNITQRNLEFPEELFAGSSVQAIKFIDQLLQQVPRLE